MLLEFKLLLMLLSANATPVLVSRCLGQRLNTPIDNGLLLADGNPLFGSSKTWRGVISGIISTAAMAPLLDFSLLFTTIFALLSLCGDLLSSFIKRRLNLKPSSNFIILDQFPEALFPLIPGAYWIGYELNTIILVTLSFFLINIFIPVLLSLAGVHLSKEN